MNPLIEIIGKACEILLPLDNAVFQGNPASGIAICTLSSVDLAYQLSHQVLQEVSMIGRLLSENKGIDSILYSLNENKNIKFLILCGKEVLGHKAGHSLIQLHKFGIDEQNFIINSSSPYPKILSSKKLIEHFQQNISIINKIDESNPTKIRQLISSMN